MPETSRTCECFSALLERQGYRELAAAQLFTAGVALAPTLDEKQMFARHCLDELGHFEQVATRYEELGHGDLLAKLRPELAKLPAPTSWPEMVLVGITFDRAVYYQLRAYTSAPDRRISDIAIKVLADEHEHLEASQAALEELMQEGGDLKSSLSKLLERWLPLSRNCFDGRELETRACPAGPHFSEAAAAESRKAYVESLERILTPRGVTLSALGPGF